MLGEHQQENKEKFDRKKVRLISFISFILGFLDAFLLYVLSSYFARISGEGMVGGFYFIAFVLVFWFLMRLQPLIHGVGSVRLLALFMSGLIATSFYLSLGEPSWFGAAALLIYLVCSNLVWSVLDVLLEDFSSDQVSGRVRGFYLTILNLGLLLAPILSTRTLSTAGYQGIFTTLAFGYGLVLIITLTGLGGHVTASLPRIAFRETLKKVSREKNLLLIYAVSWTLEFFYGVMIVYAPILLLSKGFAWEEIGIIFTIMLIPFVILQYPLGVLADKRLGEKELILGALVIMAIATSMVGFTRSTDLVVWATLLFATRLGAAAIEVLRDSYFYKQIKPGDTDIVAFFRTARPTANIVAAGVSLIFLSLFTIHSLFYLVGAIALVVSFAVTRLDDSKSEKERETAG